MNPQLTFSTLLLTILPCSASNVPVQETADAVYGMALAEAGQSLQTAYPVVEGQPIEPNDLFEHYANQLITAGGLIAAGATQAWIVMPDQHPIKVQFTTEFLGHGDLLAQAGIAIGSMMFDQAALFLADFENSLVRMELAGDAMHSHGHGVIRPACEDLRFICEGLGSGWAEQVAYVQEGLDLAASGSDAITAAVAPVAQINDRQTLALLGIHGEQERAKFLGLAQHLEDSNLLAVIENGGITAEDIVQRLGALVMTVPIYDLGRGLETTGDVVATCSEGEPTEDCPDLCTGDKDCAGCWASDIGLGFGPSNPDEYSNAGGWIAALITAGHLPTGSDPFSVATFLFGLPGYPDAMLSLFEMLRAVQLHGLSLWFKMTYECCVVEDCWDWYWCIIPLYETIQRNVCKRTTTEWKRSPATPQQLLDAVLKRDMKTIAQLTSEFEKQFCKTACAAPQ